ncbi:MAG TPA: hypothetical protein VM054_10045 [bacterium]|nr:hypothetical protein [bacterium]
MHKPIIVTAALALTAALSLVIAASTADGPVLTVVVTSDTWGELATCG